MSKKLETNLKDLFKIASDITRLEEAYAIASYEVTAVAPAAAAPRRSLVLGYLAEERIKLLNSPQMQELISYFSENDIYNNLDHMTKSAVRNYKKEMEKFSNIPPSLYSEYIAVKVQAEAVWQEAKHKNDYASYKPYLEKVIDYNNMFIDIWGYEKNRYDAFLKYQEPHMTTDELDRIFDKIKETSIDLLKRIKEKNIEIDDSFLYKPYDRNKQKLFSKHLMNEICFDTQKGVLCETEHPYTSVINNCDVRITTHFYDNNLAPAIFSTLHEGGHGLYGQNIDSKYSDCILRDGLTGSIHEASSRFWENRIGRNKYFWKRQLPYLKVLFPNELTGITYEDMYKAVNKVNNSMFRISSDELTYNLHIILRYEIEKEIFAGNLKIDDLPHVWNQKTKEYLGITPPDFKSGIMQDVHWASGLFGYFHSYTLGNIYGAQFANASKKDLTNFDELILNGEYGKILDWLTSKWYTHGKLYSGDDLIVNISGESTNPSYLCDYLTNKYEDLYKI